MNPGVPRLRLPEYNYHTEGLHGVRDSCDSPATLWPQVSGMAATGNLSLIREMGSFMGASFRAANNANRGKPLPSKGCGLSVYGPTMNIKNPLVPFRLSLQPACEPSVCNSKDK